MRNIKCIVAYDGMEFSGWQVQPGQITVQGTLNDVLERVAQHRVTIHASGRTDAGVHAAGQVMNFRTTSPLTTDEMQRAFNALLPPSIRVRAAEEVSPEFHSRWDALAKTYRYRIYRGRVVPPFVWRYVLQDAQELNFDAMAEAARYFIGEQDFTTFAASTGSDEDDRERTTVRTIYHSEMQRVAAYAATGAAEEWDYVVRGRSFMRNMVRKIVGALIEVGRGKIAPQAIPGLIALRDRSKSGPTVAPHGLCLESVEYPDPTNSLGARENS